MKARIIIALLHLFAKLPLSVNHFIAAGIGRLIFWHGGRAVSTTRINLELCYPNKSEQEREALAKASIIELAKIAFEMGPAWLWEPEKLLGMIKEVEGHELVENALNDKKGAIIIAPHLGNWEVLGVYLGWHFQATCMYQPPKEPLLDAMIFNARERCKMQLAPTDRKGIITLLKTLKSGGCIGILPDQEPDTSGGVIAPFFGQPALTMTLLSNLAQKSGAAAISAYAERLPKGRGFKLVFKEADRAIYDKDLATSVSALNRSVESCVSAIPIQYQWEYKRFKHQGEGKPSVYPK